MKRIFKKLSIMLMAMSLLICPALAVQAAHPSRVVDDAGILSQDEVNSLTEKCDKVSEKYDVDVVIVTVESIGDKTPEAFADDYFDYNGYGLGNDRSGVLFLLAMESRDWWISTRGYGINAFSDSDIKEIGSKVVSYLSGEQYAKGFDKFISLAEDELKAAKNSEKFPLFRNLIIAALVGLIVALIVTGNLKSQLKSVHSKREAYDYVRKGSMEITDAREFFIYSHVTRTARPKDTGSGSSGSSTHTSSSGATHGGGGGKF